VWGGHSCPPLLPSILCPLFGDILDQLCVPKVKVKSGGQECPPYMARWWCYFAGTGVILPGWTSAN